MKRLLALVILIFLPEALIARESLFKAEAPTEVEVGAVGQASPQTATTPQSTAPLQNSPLTNKIPKRKSAIETEDMEPGNIRARSFSQTPQGTSTWIANVFEEMNILEVGEGYRAMIPMSLLAFNEAKTPVIAHMMVNGTELVLLGEASLERNSKRITIEFVKARRKDSDKIFDLKATALARDGTPGIEAKIHSGEGKFFLAEVLAAGAAGFVDASVNRSTNGFGNTTDERSLDTQSKKAVSGALSKTAERYGEKIKTAPEYATVQGPVEINVIVLQAAKRKI